MGVLLRSASIADTHAVAAALAAVARPGDMIVLSGEMGAGKTAFAQGFGRALGVTEPITSPTFTLVHSYEIDEGGRAGKLTLHHADLYRLERTSEISDLALGELAEFRGIVLIEWGEVADAMIGDHLVVHLAPGDEDVEAGDEDDPLALDGSRLIELAGVGPAWAGRWERLTESVEGFRC